MKAQKLPDGEFITIKTQEGEVVTGVVEQLSTQVFIGSPSDPGVGCWLVHGELVEALTDA